MPAPPSRPPPRLDHATLIAAITAGSSHAGESARRDACKALAAQVYRVVAAVLGPGSPDVGDASQEAFMRVYNAIPTFEFDAERPRGPVAWVNQIALRVALDRLKLRKRPLEQTEDVDGVDATSADDLEGTLDRKQLVSALLERLDEKERAVLVLRYWNEETDQEIAETLGLPLGTVKSRLRSAGAKLRQAAVRPLELPSLLVGEGLKA